MITFERAREIALETIGPRNGLLEEHIITKPFGWFFAYQSNEFLRTGDWRHQILGGCSFIVNRETGELYEFDSLGTFERTLAAYEFGLRYEAMDLTVNRIHNLKKTLDHLVDVVNVVRRDPVDEARRLVINLPPPPPKYARDRIGESLWNLPCRFPDCEGLFYKYEQFLEIDQSRCFEYELRISNDD